MSEPQRVAACRPETIAGARRVVWFEDGEAAGLMCAVGSVLQGGSQDAIPGAQTTAAVKIPG